MSGGVFRYGAAAGANAGGVGHRGDVDRGGGARGAALAVADGVGDLDRAIDVGGRGEGEGAVGVDGDAALGRIDAGAGDAERVAVGIGVVAKHVDAHGAVFGGSGGVRVGDGGRIGRHEQGCRAGGGQEVDAVGAAAVGVGDGCDVFEDADQAHEVVGLVAKAAAGDTGCRFFEAVEGIGAAVQGLDDLVGIGAEAGNDVFAALRRGRGEEFVIEQQFPFWPDAEFCAAGQLQFHDGAGCGDDGVALGDHVTRLDGGELAAAVAQVGFALHENDSALDGGLRGSADGGCRGGHGELRKRIDQMLRNLRIRDGRRYCPQGQGA